MSTLKIKFYNILKNKIFNGEKFQVYFLFFVSRTNTKTQTLKVLKSELSKIPDIDKRLIGLKETKDKKEAELKQIKDVSFLKKMLYISSIFTEIT